jgi:hypothetical protein
MGGMGSGLGMGGLGSPMSYGSPFQMSGYGGANPYGYGTGLLDSLGGIPSYGPTGGSMGHSMGGSLFDSLFGGPLSSYGGLSGGSGLTGGYGAGGGSGLTTGYGMGANRVDLGAPHGPGHSMGLIHSMFDHHDPFTSIGYGRYADLGASWSRAGSTVTQQATIRSHPELVELATRQALEDDPNLSGEALYRNVANRLTGYNSGANGVAEAFDLTEEQTNAMGRNFNHRLHDVSAAGQQWAQALADNPGRALEMYNNGTLAGVAPVGRAGDTWRIEGGHTLQEDSFQSRAIGMTADGQVLYENTVESDNGDNNGHDGHKMVAYSVGGPMEVEIVDNNQEYALENVDRAIVNRVAAGGSVRDMPVFGGPSMGGHGMGHGMGMGMGHGMGHGMSPIGMPELTPITLPPMPSPGSCPRTGASTCSCDGNVSRSTGVSLFNGMHH